MASLRDDLLQPIPGDNPAGKFLRWESTDTTYDQIKTAREEEDDLPQGDWTRERKTADFEAVIRLAGDAIAERSKDLQLAAWLTEALTRKEGLAGLASGLDLLRGLLEQFWDHVYPPIEEDGDAEFRAAPLEWVGERLHDAVRGVPLNRKGHGYSAYRDARSLGYESEVAGDAQRRESREEAIAEGRPTPEDLDAAFEETPKGWYKELAASHAASLEAVQALGATCDEKFGEASPSFRVLREALEEVGRVIQQQLAKKLELEPDPVDAPAVEDMAMSGASATGSGTAGSGQAGQAASGPPRSAEPTSEEEAARCVASAARYFRRARPTDPAPYAMLRGYRWGELRAGDGLEPRLLTAPPTEVRTRLKTLLLDQKWAELLDAAEEVMATQYGRGWLDLQRYVLTACEGLGSEYDGVSEAVRTALGSLLQDRPELSDATLMDDSPTANPETLRWLRDEKLMPGDEADALEAKAGRVRARVRSDAGDVLDRALQTVQSGNPQKAIEMLMRAVEQDVSPRAKFLHRAQVTKIMVDSGMHGVARPILGELIQEIEDHGLENWEEGETVALPLGLLYRCLEALDGDEGTRHELYQRVCRLDPLMAMQFANGGAGSGDAEGMEEEVMAADGDGS